MTIKTETVRTTCTAIFSDLESETGSSAEEYLFSQSFRASNFPKQTEIIVNLYHLLHFITLLKENKPYGSSIK